MAVGLELAKAFAERGIVGQGRATVEIGDDEQGRPHAVSVRNLESELDLVPPRGRYVVDGDVNSHATSAMTLSET